jgi:uncharacterized circularly permuted ATP-grasp superfamily protein
MMLDQYKTESFYDELFEPDGKPRAGAIRLVDKLNSLGSDDLKLRQQAAESTLMNLGITFNVYGDDAGVEKIFPFDIIPRIVEHVEWQRLQAGLAQRIKALNLFLDDIYHDQRIIKDGAIPEFVISSSKAFLPECKGLEPPQGVWCHITGTDIIRDKDGTFYVLEDNLRCPSGVSYVLENRQVMKRTFPEVFATSNVQPVDDYPSRLLDVLQWLSGRPDPTCVVLTPGVYNSAYFEHSFLARQMGIELVEGRDLAVVDGYVQMRTTKGFRRVDVIYRRVDDTFVDPKVFNPASMLGVPGIMDVYRKGRVAMANAPGTGVADDKVVYAYIPQIIRYYLGEEAILQNVPTYVCWEDDQRKYVLDNIEQLVVKAANESGGYGMLVGPHASAEEHAKFRTLVAENPRNYIAQPTISLSRVPTIIDNTAFEGRHVDLRPYILYGKDIYVMPGGLTRVALRKGSLVVNSSQGGGSKDTWVLGE